MESYNNYQDIINAIKAEYVIVRDLKRVANAKKRELNNAHSFVNRKENEETTLETRVTNAKQAATSRANIALGAIKNAIDSDYTLDLNASAAKLAFIEAEILKLQNFSISLPEQFDAFTPNELNSIGSLKAVLLSAINDTKFIYENDIIESSKFSALKDETKLSTETSRDNDIQTHYNTIVYNVKQLIDSTRQHFADYVSTSSDMEDSLRGAKDTLVNGTRALVLAKSELADLLDSNAPQTQIDAKNVEIDELKIQAVEKANVLKARDIETELFYTNKHKDFSVYFEVIHSLYEEVENWLSAADAQIFVRYNSRDYRRDIQTYIRKFMEELITSIGEKIPTANGQSLSQIIGQVFAQASNEVMNADQAIENSYRKNNVLSDLDSYTDYDSQTGEFTLSTDVPGRVWYDSLDYLKALHQMAQGYMGAKKHLQVKESTFHSRRMIFEEGFSEAFNTYIPAFNNAHMDSRLHQFELVRKMEGVWTGTPEQETAYLNLESVRRVLLTDLSVAQYRKDLTALNLSLYSGMFPSFYSEEIALKSAKESTLATLTSITNTMADMYIVKQAAYDFLQTLTETDEEYQAAFTAWNNAVSEYESLLAAYNALTPQYDSLVSNLAEVSVLYGGGIDFGSGFDDVIFSTAIQSDGKILVGGDFLSYNGTGASKIIRLNTDGSRDTSFVIGTGFSGTYPWVRSIAIQSDGKIVVGGNFANYNGTSASKIIRLNTDGSIDTSFVIGTGLDNICSEIAIQSDGKILVGGYFSSYNGTSANKIIRLNTDGSVDTSFVTGTGFQNSVMSIAIQSNGKILVGGNFSEYNGTNANKIIRLNSDGSRDTSFVIGTGFDSDVNSIAIQSDGKIVVGGEFYWYNGTFVKRIIRLNSDGSIDTSFVYGDGFNGYANSVAIQSDGKIVVGGQFQSYNGTNANYIIRLNSNGSIDTSFVYGTGFDGDVESITIQSNGKILVGGYFTSYQGTSANRIIQLSDSFNAEFEDEFNEATDALNAFQTDIRIPASNAKNAALIVSNETYGILQPLTEIDEEYAEAFNDWDSKEIAFGEYDLNVKAPATVAANEASAAYDSLLSTQYGTSGFTPSGSVLMGVKSEADGYVIVYDDKQSQLSENYTSLQAIKSEMTLVDSDLATKLEAYGWIDDEHTKANKAVQYWSNLIDSNCQSLSTLSNSIIQSYNQIVDHSPYEVNALQQLKDFLDGNTEYSTNKNDENYGHRLLFRAEYKEDFSETVLGNMFNMDENTFEQYFRPDNATTMAFKTNPTFLSNKLRSIAQSYRGNANAGFADQVISFVNTGVSNF